MEEKQEYPSFDAENADHVRRWELAGRPDINELDGDGQPWRPTVKYVRANEEDEWTMVPAPVAAPVSDSDVTKPSSQQMLEDLAQKINQTSTLDEMKTHLLDIVTLLKGP